MTEESTTGKSSYWPLAGIAITALVLGILAASYLKPNQEQASAGITSIGGDFTLQSSKGPISLRDFKGKVVPLYFGFASCPDVCPTSLGLLASAIRQLPAEQQQQIQPVFISVDPGRDTPEILEAYANAFYPGMLGLTDKKETIDDVTWKYRALYKIVPMEDSAMGYTVDHSSIIYVIGRNGVIQSLAQHGTTPAELVEKLKHALARS
jgi:protein SCO1/2